MPQRLRVGGVWRAVSLVRSPWRIEQGWWRGEPVGRDYYRIALEDGTPLTVYRDLVSGDWARQEY